MNQFATSSYIWMSSVAEIFVPPSYSSFFRCPPLRQWMVISNFLRIISSQEVLQTSLGDVRNNIKHFSQLCKKFTLIDVSFFKKMHRPMLMPLLASFHVRRKHGEVWGIAFAAVNYVFRNSQENVGPLFDPIMGTFDPELSKFNVQGNTVCIIYFICFNYLFFITWI